MAKKPNKKTEFAEINPSNEEIATRKRAWDYANFFQWLPDPDHVLRSQGGRLGDYEKLMSDAHLGSVVQSRKAGTLSREWKIEKAGGSTRFHKLITAIFEKLDVSRIIAEILDAPLFGYKPLEILWKRADGVFLPADVLGKPPEWFSFSPTNELLFRSKTDTIGTAVPERKFLLPRHDPTYDNPYGRKLLSRCFWPVTFKKAGFSFWMVFLEKYGMPFTVGRYPRGTQPEQVDELVTMLERMTKDAVAAVPEGNQVELIQAGSSSGKVSYGDMLHFANGEISKAILGQTLTTEINEVGSYSAAQTHFAVRKEIIEEDQRLVQQALNELINHVAVINGFEKPLPEFVLIEEEELQKDRAERDEILTRMGVNFNEQYFSDQFHLDSKHFKLISPTFNSPPVEGWQAKPDGVVKKKVVKFAEGDDPDDVAEVGTPSDDELLEQSQALLQTVIDLAEESKNYKEFAEKLDAAYSDIDTKKIAKILENKWAIARLWGEMSNAPENN